MVLIAYIILMPLSFILHSDQVTRFFFTDERTNCVIAHFLFTMVWSVGATLDGQSRIKFDEFFRNLCEMEGSQATYPK